MSNRLLCHQYSLARLFGFVDCGPGPGPSPRTIQISGVTCPSEPTTQYILNARIKAFSPADRTIVLDGLYEGIESGYFVSHLRTSERWPFVDPSSPRTGSYTITYVAFGTAPEETRLSVAEEVPQDAGGGPWIANIERNVEALGPVCSPNGINMGKTLRVAQEYIQGKCRRDHHPG